MGRPMYLSLIAVCAAAALFACPSATAGWPVDSSFYDEIKRIVYGGGGDDDAAAGTPVADSSTSGTDSPLLPPLSLPSSQASTYLPYTQSMRGALKYATRPGQRQCGKGHKRVHVFYNALHYVTQSSRRPAGRQDPRRHCIVYRHRGGG